MDGDGIPLAFSIHPGNKGEQQTLIPLEEQILKDFQHAKFIVCTDAGLSSRDNRKSNNKGGRSFITTQSIKKLKKHLKDWCLESTGWKLEGFETDKKEGTITFDIRQLEADEKLAQKFRNSTFYKERWSREDGLKKHHQNDCKRFIKKTGVTAEGGGLQTKKFTCSTRASLMKKQNMMVFMPCVRILRMNLPGLQRSTTAAGKLKNASVS